MLKLGCLTQSIGSCWIHVSPVFMLCCLRIFEMLCTLSKELKCWMSWCKPYIPFWCWGKPVSKADLSPYKIYTMSLHRLHILHCLYCIYEGIPWSSPLEKVTSLHSVVKVVWVSSGNAKEEFHWNACVSSGNASKEFREQWERRSHAFPPTLNTGWEKDDKLYCTIKISLDDDLPPDRRSSRTLLSTSRSLISSVPRIGLK